MNSDVTEKSQVYKECNKIVTELIKIRKNARFSQKFMAEWLGVSRKKINEFENGSFDFYLMAEYADKLSVEIKINYIIY